MSNKIHIQQLRRKLILIIFHLFKIRFIFKERIYLIIVVYFKTLYDRKKIDVFIF